MNNFPYKPRIFMIIRDMEAIGGAQLNALRLATRLHSMGLDISVIGYGPETASREHLQRYSINPDIPVQFIAPPSRVFQKIAGFFPNIIFLMPCLHKLWRHRKHYDILHGPLLMESGLVCGLATLLTGKPSLVKLGSAGRYGDVRRALKGYFRFIRRSLFRRISKFVCLTREIEDELFKDLLIPRSRCVLIRNGVDTRLFRPGTPEQKIRFRQDLGLKGTSKIVICVGRLEKKKRIEFLLQAWRSIVYKAGGSAQLLIVGDGTLRNSLEALCRRLHIAERVTFYGNSEDISVLMQGADLFALPSVSEGLANVFLEAMASALPLVTTDTPGNREILTHGENALLFPEKNLDAFSEGMLTLLENEAFARRMGQSGRRCVETHYDIEKIARQYVRLYHDMVHGTIAPGKT